MTASELTQELFREAVVHALPVGDGTIWFTSANEEHILEVWANDND
jgi:hypothetical protein